MPEVPIERIQVKQTDLRSTVLPRLVGTVFHVTSHDALTKIIESRVIRSNRDGHLGFTYPQSQVSYGRRRGYVCLFDFRSVSDPELQDALMKFYFLDPMADRPQNPAFLFLDDSEYGRLVPGTSAKGNHGEMWIPFVESWYPGNLPLTAITEVLAITITREPDSPHLQALRAANVRPRPD
jgi:hypothetical protein